MQHGLGATIREIAVAVSAPRAPPSPEPCLTELPPEISSRPPRQEAGSRRCPEVGFRDVIRAL